MFQILKPGATINFMRWAKLTTTVSLILVILSIGVIAVKGFNWGLDFTGGTLIEVSFVQPVELDDVRSQLAANGFSDAIVQHFGSSKEVMARVAPRDGVKGEVVGEQILTILKTNLDENVEMRRIEFVGPNVGAELAENGGLAIIVALACILLYVSMRFEWRLALGSVAALAHDVIVTLGIFSLFELEFDLTVLAAVLAVVGYSLNDTIVVFDRIRENFRRVRKGTAVEIVDLSLTQTLSRTLITSSTTLFVLVALYFKGGALIHGFATALLLGIFIGTYSSIYIASGLALALGISREDMIPVEIEKEGADQEPVA